MKGSCYIYITEMSKIQYTVDGRRCYHLQCRDSSISTRMSNAKPWKTPLTDQLNTASHAGEVRLFGYG